MKDKDYEQKKRECWDALHKELLDGEVQWQPVSRKEIFNFAFDRAYALGKLQASCGQVKEGISQEDIEKASVKYANKTAEQYEVCNSEFVQEIMVAFEQGANFALGKQEKDADSVIQGWVARDSNESLYLFCLKPRRVRYPRSSDGVWMSRAVEKLDPSLFPDLTWESDPIEVEIIIKRKKKTENQ